MSRVVPVIPDGVCFAHVGPRDVRRDDWNRVTRYVAEYDGCQHITLGEACGDEDYFSKQLALWRNCGRNVNEMGVGSLLCLEVARVSTWLAG